MAGRLIVEHLDDETLVYDTERNEAHALSGAGSAEFLAAEDEVSRREILRKLALAGAAAAGTGALVRTIIAPTPAQAQTAGQLCGPGNTCNPGLNCCVNINNAVCCAQPCCTAAVGGDLCCGPGLCNPGVGCIVVSDRNLKHDLAPVGPQDLLAALGL
jgi:hypothetical protein